jgi:hypothetical protein
MMPIKLPRWREERRKSISDSSKGLGITRKLNKSYLVTKSQVKFHLGFSMENYTLVVVLKFYGNKY